VQTILHKLINLPEPSLFDFNTEIYETFQFTQDDQQSLMDIADEKHFSLPEYDEDEEDGFTHKHYDVSVHAYRALSRFNDIKHLPFFIELNDSEVSFDECFLYEDMPLILSQYGDEAILLLTAAINDQDMKEIARSTVVTALENLAKQEIELNSIIQELTSYISKKHFTRDLNARIISTLITLNATQKIDVIRSIFAAHLCDISVVGDLETVEISLGLRSNRKTPERNIHEYEDAELHLALKEHLAPRPENSDSAAIFFYLHSLYSRENSLQDVSEIQGYIAGTLLATTPLSPQKTFEGIWDDPENYQIYSPNWENTEDFELYMKVFVALHTAVEDGLLNSHLDPLLSSNEGYPMFSVWFSGFSRGLSLVIDDPKDLLLNELLINITILITLETSSHSNNLDSYNQSETSRLYSNILDRIYVQYNQIKHGRSPILRALSNGDTYTREDAKISRNAPCPCGSEKKYKRCCMN